MRVGLPCGIFALINERNSISTGQAGGSKTMTKTRGGVCYLRIVFFMVADGAKQALRMPRFFNKYDFLLTKGNLQWVFYIFALF